MINSPIHFFLFTAVRNVPGARHLLKIVNLAFLELILEICLISFFFSYATQANTTPFISYRTLMVLAYAFLQLPNHGQAI